MADWGEGYVSEIDYTYGCFREIGVASMRWALLHAGWDLGPLAKPDLTFCELAFGHGVSLVMSAAAMPQASFYGTDINPRQTHGARQLAAEGGVENVVLADDSLEQWLNRDDLPMFDVVVLHGLYSWVNDENRDHVVRFLDRRLAIGGTAFVSYNALPGWAALMPLRDLMNRTSTTGGVLARVQTGMALAERMKSQGAGYFRANPVVERQLSRLGSQDPAYIAHEYMTGDMQPKYHADVAAEMRSAKLDFTTAARAADQLDTLNVNADAVALLNETANPTERETLRDYFTNCRFRRDLFVKGPLRRFGGAADAVLMEQRFALAQPRSTAPERAKLPIGEITMRPEIYGPLLDRLETSPATVAELQEHSGQPTPPLVEALALMTTVGHVAACLPPGEGSRESTDAMNASLLERACHSDTIGYLCSPEVGTGVPLDQVGQLLLRAHREGDAPVDFVWETMRSLGKRFLKADGSPAKSDAENLAVIDARASAFPDAELPVLRGLGIAD